MKKILLGLFILLITFFSGCSTVPLEPKNISDEAKLFNLPPTDTAGIYVYRDSALGGALKKDIFIDSKCLGESAPFVFFYKNVKGNQDHNISTESEFSPNLLTLNTQSGKNYFIRQYLKLGVFVGGANLEVVTEEEAKKAFPKLNMARKGICSGKQNLSHFEGSKLRCARIKENVIIQKYDGKILNNKIIINDKDYSGKYVIVDTNIDDIVENDRGHYCNIIKEATINNQISLEDKLKEIQRLKENTLITDEEYKIKRKQLIDTY